MSRVKLRSDLFRSAQLVSSWACTEPRNSDSWCVCTLPPIESTFPSVWLLARPNDFYFQIGFKYKRVAEGILRVTGMHWHPMKWVNRPTETSVWFSGGLVVPRLQRELGTHEDSAKNLSLVLRSIPSKLSVKTETWQNEQAMVIFLSCYQDFCATSESAICHCSKPRNEETVGVKFFVESSAVVGGFVLLLLPNGMGLWQQHFE